MTHFHPALQLFLLSVGCTVLGYNPTSVSKKTAAVISRPVQVVGYPSRVKIRPEDLEVDVNLREVVPSAPSDPHFTHSGGLAIESFNPNYGHFQPVWKQVNPDAVVHDSIAPLQFHVESHHEEEEEHHEEEEVSAEVHKIFVPTQCCIPSRIRSPDPFCCYLQCSANAFKSDLTKAARKGRRQNCACCVKQTRKFKWNRISRAS